MNRRDWLKKKERFSLTHDDVEVIVCSISDASEFFNNAFGNQDIISKEYSFQNHKELASRSLLGQDGFARDAEGQIKDLIRETIDCWLKTAHPSKTKYIVTDYKVLLGHNQLNNSMGIYVGITGYWVEEKYFNNLSTFIVKDKMDEILKRFMIEGINKQADIWKRGLN